MNWQLWLVGLIVALAASYVLRASWRAWTGTGKACGGGCCGPKAPAATGTSKLITGEQLTARLRTRQSPPNNS